MYSLGKSLVVNCQSDLLERIDTRFVIPLAPERDAPMAARRLNPVFDIAGERHVLVTQQAATVHRRELGEPLASLVHRSIDITDAIDVLLSGV